MTRQTCGYKRPPGIAQKNLRMAKKSPQRNKMSGDRKRKLNSFKRFNHYRGVEMIFLLFNLINLSAKMRESYLIVKWLNLNSRVIHSHIQANSQSTISNAQVFHFSNWSIIWAEFYFFFIKKQWQIDFCSVSSSFEPNWLSWTIS